MNRYQTGGSTKELYRALFDEEPLEGYYNDEEEDNSDVTSPSEQEVAPVEDPRYQQAADLANEIMMGNYQQQDQFADRKQYSGTPHNIPAGAINDDELQVVVDAAETYGVPKEILAGVYGAETNFGGNVKRSSAGAQGAFQFMNATARQYGVDVNNFESSAKGAAHYLSDMYKHYGDWELAVAAYNGGYAQANNMRAGKSVAKETAGYVPKVMGYAQSFKNNQ